jgi:small-conductance mechanosensitive channel/CRP-like cAMP-binding protein
MHGGDVKTFGWPLILTGVFFLVYVILRLAGSPGMQDRMLEYLFATGLVSLSVVLVRALNLLFFDVIFYKRIGRPAPALLRVIVSIILYPLLLALIYREILDGELSGIVATSAVVSVILGLALQDTLGNFFAGISLQVEQPFQIGDVIRLRNVFGRVESVTWRSTTIRTNDNTLMTFPNSLIARETMEILPATNLNRRVLGFPAPLSVPPQTVIPLVRELVRTMPNVAPERTPVVRIQSFDHFRMNYEVLYWVKDYMLVVDMDARIRERIWYAFQRYDITLPVPINHTRFERAVSLPPAPQGDYGAILAQVDILSPLTSEEIAEVVREGKTAVYAPGEYILQSGESGDSMFIICHGKAEVRLPIASGGPQALAVLGPGDYFGEMALFTGEPRQADIYAVDEVQVFEIRKASIGHLFHANAQLAEAFSQKIAERLASRASHGNRTMEEEVGSNRETILRRIQRFFSL